MARSLEEAYSEHCSNSDPAWSDRPGAGRRPPHVQHGRGSRPRLRGRGEDAEGEESMIHIIVNPAGAGGKTLEYFRKSVLPLFAQSNYEIHFSSKERGVGEITAALTDPGRMAPDSYVNLVIVGGDGTMNEVMNGIRDFEHTRVGIVPAGSGNDLARGLDLPSDLRGIVSRIRQEKTFRQIDVGETILHDRDVRMRFVVSSGIGFDAEVCHRIQAASLKSILNRVGLGKLVYLLEAVRLIFQWRSAPAALYLCSGEGEEKLVRKLDRFVFTAAMNHRFEGGGFMLCPKASDEDGQMDYCIVHDLTVSGFFRFFPLALKGKHVRHKECVGQARGLSLRVRSEKPLCVHCDGEAVYTSGDAQMGIAPYKLNLMV